MWVTDYGQRTKSQEHVVPLKKAQIPCAVAVVCVQVFDKQLQCLRTMYGHDGAVTCLALDGNTHVASGSHDATVRLWCVDTGACECVLEGHTDSVLNVGLDALHVVSSSEDDTIRIWSRYHAEIMHVLREPSMSFVLHPSSVLVTACDGVLTAW